MSPRPAHAAEAFRVRLTPVPIDVQTSATVTGSGSAEVTLDGRRLELTGTFAGLQGPATAARLHQGLAKGVRGPAIHDLEITAATSGSVSGEIELTRAQVDSLRAGRLYIQIHGQSAPEGNLWGWLVP
jgi:hypothetical protein